MNEITLRAVDIALFDRLTGEASTITITVHTHPDGDAIGSGTAMLAYLTRTLGKDAVLIVPDAAPDTLSFVTKGVPSGEILDFERDTKAAKARIEASDLLIVLDCNAFSRTAGMESLLSGSKASKILVDHHLNPDTASFNLVFSKTDISSASELLFWVLMRTAAIGGDASKLPSTCADALLTGMTTDTNNFANSVFPSTFAMASSLLQAGVDRGAILASLYQSYRENRIRLMGCLFSEKLQITPQGVAYIILDEQTQARFDFRKGESEGFVNMPLSIAGVRMSIFITQEGDEFRTSVRSKVGTSANAFASRYFHGGGHELAAGGKLLRGKDFERAEDIKAYILKAIAEFL